VNETQATRYQRLRRRGRVAGVLSGGLMLALVALTPWSRRLADWAIGFGRGMSGVPLVPVALFAFIIVLVLGCELAALPAVLYDARRRRRRPASPEASVAEVLAAQAHAAAVALPAALAVALVWLVAVRLAGPWWWALAAGLLAGLLVAGLRGAPAVLARLAEARPLPRPALMARLTDLARRARVSVAGISEWRVADASETAALVTGFGRTRRVFIASALVRDWSDEEIAVVVAHELAHHAHHDLWRAVALDALVLALALGAADAVVGRMSSILHVSGPGDLAALPLIALVTGAVWLVATPLRHAESRRQERRADRFALGLTGGADAFSAAIRRLAARHLAEERPAMMTRWFFQRHPSIAERLALAEHYRQR
jgi:STE24 endopeptidase